MRKMCLRDRYYRKLEDAVKATSGIVMTYENRCIDPMLSLIHI